MAVYLLHFDKPYKHARHYIGYTPGNVERRIAMHRKGTGARLMAVIQAAGIGFEVANTWPDAGREEERRLKRRGGAASTCSICRAGAARKRLVKKVATHAVSLLSEETVHKIRSLMATEEDKNAG